ncbi:SDR family oxidoreductase [Rhodococcus triatomae]|nr:nucleotide-sugar epimerase [Rhodococcus triatomae BKS 15-14]
MTVMVTGGSGFLGRSVVRGLREANQRVVSVDLRSPSDPLDGVTYAVGDVCDPESMAAVLADHAVETVVHLASIVNPGRSTTPEQEYRVDVEGSRTVLGACVAHGVRRIVVSSSGAAYGYHDDNPSWITEDTPLRGNDSFPYSRHKRLVEEMLAEYRRDHPELEQTIFRIGTILGADVDNQITALFEKNRLLKIRGSDSPFVFVWDQDVASAMVQACVGSRTGIFNVAGDGAMTVDDIAETLGKRTLTVAPSLVRLGLRVGHALKLTVHGPEQVKFLQYRPVLDNNRLKCVFGYTPRYTTREAFGAWQATRSAPASDAGSRSRA